MKRYTEMFVHISVLQYAHIHTQDVDVFECSQQHKEWQDAWDEGDKIEVEKQGLDEHGMF